MMLLTFIALITVPFKPGLRTQALIGAAAIVQIVINASLAPAGVGAWLGVLG